MNNETIKKIIKGANHSAGLNLQPSEYLRHPQLENATASVYNNSFNRGNNTFTPDPPKDRDSVWNFAKMLPRLKELL